MENKKILVGISGGVDSSTAIFLLKNQGYQPIGMTLKVIENTRNSKFEKEIERTRALCEKLKIDHVVKHVEKEFFEQVITDFVETYLNGETPNPCVLCNRTIKWKFLLSAADEMGIDKVATGHYVRIEKHKGLYELHRGIDNNKDQSYMLWQLTQKELSRTLFPLGDYQKDEVYEIACKNSLIPKNLSESQDICFIPENDYRKYLADNFPEKLKKIGQGQLIDIRGNVLGEHEGFYNFTIGQRKGFKKGFNERKYVRQIDADKNQVIISSNDELFSDGMILREINYPSEKAEKLFSGKIKIRYNSRAVDCTGEMLDNSTAKVIFSKPQRAVTPGQSAVLYRRDKVIFGGLIKTIL